MGEDLANTMSVKCLILVAVLCVAIDAKHAYTRVSKAGNFSAVGRLEEKKAEAGGLCDPNVTQYSGYYTIDEANKTNQNYFYWMFESRSAPKTDPLVLWLTGGPGCSGMLALLAENGACTIKKDSAGALAEVNNIYSWTNNANVLWVDQPTGVGFSYGASGDYDHDELGVRSDMYHFLAEFITAHPEYAAAPFYVFGESYGGHYAPNVAYAVLEGNKEPANADLPKINLKGLAVGNGLTDPEVQYPYYPEMAYNNTYACPGSQKGCGLKLTTPYQLSGLNSYDVRI